MVRLQNATAKVLYKLFLIYWRSDLSLIFTTTIMKAISAAQIIQILTLLDSGLSLRKIAAQTGLHYSTISRVCSRLWSTLLKSTREHPKLLSSTTLCYSKYFIISGKADTVVNVAKFLSQMMSRKVSTHTVCRELRKIELKAHIKSKRPFLF